jgi:hypothetical protein
LCIAESWTWQEAAENGVMNFVVCAPQYFSKFQKIFSYFKILINLSTYITYNENIASFIVLHKPFIRIYQLFSCWILVYETRLEARPLVLASPSFFP